MCNLFRKGLNELKNKIYSLADRKIDKLDVILWAVCLLVLFVSFCHPDIMLTGNRGMFMQKHFADFYDACKEWTGDAGANYLPSTFFVYAIWTLPLRLFGFFPASVWDNAIYNVAWYRILPIGLFFLTSLFIKKIGMLLGMDEKKAKLTQIAFLAFPTAIFSQFIFSQYDIFTVFPIVLGYYYYLQKKEIPFIACFGIAMTFKYQALIYFLVLLLLREKRILRIIVKTIGCCILTGIEILLYYRSPGFKESVFGFPALSFTNQAFVYGGVYSINLFMIVILIALIGAYITKEDDNHKWDLFYLNLVTFAFFAMIVYNPQWILLTVPFFVLTIMTSKHQKFMLILSEIFIICDYFLVAEIFIGNVDMVMFANSLLKNICPDTWLVTMRDVYPYKDWTHLWTILFVIYGAYLTFSHPRFKAADINNIEQDTRINIRLGFLLSVFVWIVPAYYCLAVTKGWF